jgi:alkaline phosphatase D
VARGEGAVKLDRRQLLAGLVAVSCRAPSAAEPGPVSQAFPLGVASGEATATGAFVWTGYFGSDPVTLELSRGGVVEQTLGVVIDAGTHTGLVSLGSLTPYTDYTFEFVAGGVRSGVGHFRTAPLEARRLRVGAASCLNQAYALTPLLRAAEQDLDVFLLLGDTLYADGAKSEADFRLKWQWALERFPQRTLRASTSVIATWDDHEIINNVSGDAVDGSLIGAARDAFYAYQPLRRGPTIWRKRSWGPTLDVFVLDCRGERNHATGEYLSAAQFDWLTTGLAASTARFKLIMNSVPISEYQGALFEPFASDRWEGFPEQRKAVLDFIDQRAIPGVVWVTGDFHMGVAGRVSESGPGSTQHEFAVGPAGQAANPAFSYPGPPQFDFSTAYDNVTVFDLDPDTGQARVTFFDGDGKVLFDRVYTP